MADERIIEHSKEVYTTLCAALEAREWVYDKDEENLRVSFGVSGDDIPMHLYISIEPEMQLIRVVSPLPFAMNEEKRIEGAVAACSASYNMLDGNFDYDVSSGKIFFRLTASYRNSRIGEGMFHYLITIACDMVDKYNDKFLALDKGIISLSDF